MICSDSPLICHLTPTTLVDSKQLKTNEHNRYSAAKNGPPFFICHIRHPVQSLHTDLRCKAWTPGIALESCSSFLSNHKFLVSLADKNVMVLLWCVEFLKCPSADLSFLSVTAVWLSLSHHDQDPGGPCGEFSLMVSLKDICELR